MTLDELIETLNALKYGHGDEIGKLPVKLIAQEKVRSRDIAAGGATVIKHSRLRNNYVRVY